MKKNRLGKWVLLIVLSLLTAISVYPVLADKNPVEEFFDSLSLDSREDGGAYTLIDEDGNVLMRTARHVHVGDRWQGMDNHRWVVYAVEGDLARAKPATSGGQTWLGQIQSTLKVARVRPVQQKGENKKRIGIYSTHGAESYVESDGSDSVSSGGGIIDVAESLKNGLEKDGVEAIQSKETHVPHDANAYKRSRDTAQELLREGVDAVIDVHRDAIAGEEYIEDGMVQIQLVVGRQNQNQGPNQEFAEKLKAAADEQYPGLIKGIFSAKGNYNQDMSPQSLLIDVGTHESDKAGAEESVEKFADVLTTVLYGSTDPTEQEETAKATTKGSTAWKTILWILAVALVGGGAFLYISAGSWEEMTKKLKGFFTNEFKDVLNYSGKNRHRDD